MFNRTWIYSWLHNFLLVRNLFFCDSEYWKIRFVPNEQQKVEIDEKKYEKLCEDSKLHE